MKKTLFRTRALGTSLNETFAAREEKTTAHAKKREDKDAVAGEEEYVAVAT